ncbi:MAG: Ig-like domain-containing protein, partial [Candidatus Krumholzibacteria bacterium]|nr:Ig-like domain-containing protein [Candidatus Krumholzibacteria bacterium]
MSRSLPLAGLLLLEILLSGAGALHAQEPGSVVAWGYNGSGQCDAPASNLGFVSVAGGGAHSLGLKLDGTIVAWGFNFSGQCNVPSPNTGFVKVAAGYFFSLGLKSDGRIVPWGDNDRGQLSIPSPNENFVAVAAGYEHSLGLKSDGTIVAWGRHDFYQCTVPSPNADYIAVAAGMYHSLGLKSDGTIVAWGGNSQGQLDVPAPNAGFVAIAAGYDHSLGLKSDGTIVAWGRSSEGQCTVPAPNGGFEAVAGGGYHSLGLKADGAVVAWGYNENGQCSVPTPNEGFMAVAGGAYHSLAVLESLEQPQILSASVLNAFAGSDIAVRTKVRAGTYPIGSVTLYYTIDGGPAQSQSAVYQGDSIWVASPGQFPGGSAIAWRLVARDAQNNEAFWPTGGGWLFFKLLVSGPVVAWGRNDLSQCSVPEPNDGLCAVAAGWSHSLGLKSDGTISAWGSNSFGQRDVPAPNEQYTAVAAGWDFSLGLKAEGTIEALGIDNYDQCNLPVSNEDCVAVAAGWYHGLGLRSDGTIVAWGRNDDGQCDVPAPNGSFTAIAGGITHSAGLKQDGSIVVWGSNLYHQCDVPVPNADFIAISSGGHHILGLKSDGSIIAWGYNPDGRCNVPEPNENFTAVAGGGSHSLGLKQNGSIEAWGLNGNNQCIVPEPDANFAAMAGGVYHSLAVQKTAELAQIVSANVLNAFEGFDITVRANVQAGDFPVSTVTLLYTIDGGPELSQSAAQESDSIWVASLGQHPSGTEIAWRLVVRDEQNGEAFWPAGGGSLTFVVTTRIPPTIGVYADDQHSVTSFTTTGPYQSIPVWIWCRPGEDGAKGAEFALEMPAGSFLISSEYPAGAVTMGDLAGGLSIDYGVGACEQDWHWVAKAAMMMTHADPSYVAVVEHPAVGALHVLTCENALQTAVGTTILSINGYGLNLTGARGIDRHTILVEFSNPVDPADAGTAANYEVFETAVPTNTFAVTAAELLAGNATVRLTLGSEMTLGTQYTVSVSNVRDTGGMEIEPGSEISFVLNEPLPPAIASLAAVDQQLLEIVFSEPVDPVSAQNAGNYGLFATADPADTIPISLATLQPDGTTVRLVHGGSLVHNTSYTVRVSSVADTLGNAIDPPAGTAFLFLDTYAPSVAGAEAVSDTVVTVAFSEQIDPSAADPARFQVSIFMSSPLVTIPIASAQMAPGGDGVILALGGRLSPVVTYRVEASQVTD